MGKHTLRFIENSEGGDHGPDIANVKLERKTSNGVVNWLNNGDFKKRLPSGKNFVQIKSIEVWTGYPDLEIGKFDQYSKIWPEGTMVLDLSSSVKTQVEQIIDV